MTIRYSNSKFLTILAPIPLEGLGWECVVKSHSDFVTVVARIGRFKFLSGSIAQNDFGSGSVELDFDDRVLSDPLPVGYDGSILDKEYLFEFYEDGIMRHQWFGEDVEENVADEDGNLATKISGRTTEKVLEWGMHVPEYMEYQTVKIPIGADAGTFSLYFGSEYTSSMAYNVSESGMKSALVALSQIGSADVIVEKVPETDENNVQTAWVYELKFVGKFLEGNTFAPGVRIRTNTVTDDGNAVDIEISDIESLDFNAEYEGSAAGGWLAEFERANERGTLDFVMPLFDADEDSYGNPWSDSSKLEFQSGESLLALMQRLSDANGWEFRMLPGFKLQVVQGGFGNHKEEEVIFWLGGHQKNQTRKRTTRDVTTAVYSVTEESYVAKALGSSLTSPHNRELWVEAGGSTDVTEAQKVANQTLIALQNQIVEREVKVPYGMTQHKLFQDFDINDYIAVEDEKGVQNPVKLIGVAWTVDQDAQVDLELTIDG